MSTLSILNYFLKVATMRGFSNISVTSSLGVVVGSYSLLLTWLQVVRAMYGARKMSNHPALVVRMRETRRTGL